MRKLDNYDKEKIERLKKWSKGQKQPPFYLCIRPSYQCNLNCISCVDHPNKKGHAVSDEKYLSLIKEAVNLGIRELRIDGGAEPLIRLELIKNIVRMAKENNMKGFMTSNSTLFDKKLVEDMVKLEWDVVNLSMQGDSSKLDNKLRGKEAFERTIKTLELFKIVKEKFNSNKPNIRITVLVHKLNYKRLPNFVKLANKYGADMTIQAFALWSEKGKKLKFDEKDYKLLPKYVKKTKNLADKFDIYTNVDALLEKNLLENTNNMSSVIHKDAEKSKSKKSFFNLPCFEPWYFMMITEQGKVARCIGDFDNDFYLGNKSLKAIWESSHYRKLRKNLMNNIMPEFCKRCCHPQVMETREIRERLKNKVLNKNVS
jgi:radical SAM protein with 4Fe4S-binding SPASM domain